ncbi:hypothetical protein ARMGADRAFT_1070586 [Armillaria gallica]|uniref:Ribonuclease H1 N-terminal domain-containing protein n=1 Tax=Armillaria gallica TaxID=47427 RepID=A0A2H3E9M9_ARMGA|nr:hypothetical protein ARMGADRAFT_1070586 [Armillaria gallica]
MSPVLLTRPSTPSASSTMSDLSTESSLSMDSVSEALKLIIISSDDDEQPPPGHYSRWQKERSATMSTGASQAEATRGADVNTVPSTPLKKGRSATMSTDGSQAEATRVVDANTAPPLSPFQPPAFSPQRPREPWATMQSTGRPDGFYAVMNGRIMGVFDSWNLTEGSFSGFTHQSYRKFPSLTDAITTWEDSWKNEEIGYPADRQSNQRRLGAEWVRTQRHLTPQFYWVVVKGDFPGVYTNFECALHSAGVQQCEVVVTRDINIATRLFDDLMQCGEVVVV